MYKLNGKHIVFVGDWLVKSNPLAAHLDGSHDPSR